MKSRALGGPVEDVALKPIATKFSNLALIPIPKDKLNLVKPISDVGVDSMLGAEFRGWIYQTFKIDVPYLTVLSSSAMLAMLSGLVSTKLVDESGMRPNACLRRQLEAGMPSI
ncbi:hypothetical protein F5Y14DRAFT_326857 [Nemania sp. NC0429]|nr:hypothetical protein F5Y14DRAFT_326857 [Nemania sp. NC0429]